MTVWHWVRHGPTHERRFVGWRDVPADLSDTDQIARLNRYLPSQALLVSSDLRRAAATADVLAHGRTRLPSDPNLREFHFGEWDGKSFPEVSERHPTLSRAYWETPGDVRPPGGESWNDAAARIKPVIDTVNRHHPDQHIIAVAHIGVIMTQIQRATGQEATDIIGHQIANLSVTTLVHDAGTWRVEVINHCP